MCPWQNWLSVFTDHYSMSLFHNFWSSRILSEVWVVIWFVNRKCFCCLKHPYFDVEWRLCSHQRAEGMCRARGRKSEPHDDDPGWLSRRVACQKSPSLRYVPRCSPRTPATITVCTCEGACFPPCVLHVSYVPTFHSRPLASSRGKAHAGRTASSLFISDGSSCSSDCQNLSLLSAPHSRLSIT